MEINIRRISQEDFEKVSKIVCRNFMEVNIKDYTKEEMERLRDIYTPEKINSISNMAHMYVACINEEIVGCGAIHSFWGKEDESMLRTIFVQPEFHGKGIGRKLIETLESDEIFKRAKRVEVPASITSYEFYIKMGYTHLNGMKKLDDERHYRLEKIRFV
ncbi:GNAT family N-acetyltransferase [Sedimentibacter sp. zth1]|uniref:GNAT family N-acetyltransferase n=1 Tax=Sedimentibacter sp. zth1 TaxID=2816908 RepID=UPI001A9385BD|nr:GNAT family N-acetyltransferase [Sedimentibacter sp. zth1]QSX04670.1 GNAT family N-acetyltransferase [Sedimentibacter sp. zth1]